MSKIPTTSIRDLPVGTRFILTHEPAPHGSRVLEKIEDIPYTSKSGKTFEGLFYNARWCDGPHQGKPCVLVTGSEKEPRQVIALP